MIVEAHAVMIMCRDSGVRPGFVAWLADLEDGNELFIGIVESGFRPGLRMVTVRKSEAAPPQSGPGPKAPIVKRPPILPTTVPPPPAKTSANSITGEPNSKQPTVKDRHLFQHQWASIHQRLRFAGKDLLLFPRAVLVRPTRHQVRMRTVARLGSSGFGSQCSATWGTTA